MRKQSVSSRACRRQRRLDRIARREVKRALMVFLGRRIDWQLRLEMHRITCDSARRVYERWGHLARQWPNR